MGSPKIISKITVQYQNGERETFFGTGTATVTHTEYAAQGKGKDKEPARPCVYLEAHMELS